MTEPVIFISYSHEDEREKDELLSHLEVLEHQGIIDLWNDDRIGAGADWEQEISEAIAQARVAILLISANFLTSDFILGEEVPRLLKRHESEGLIVFPVIIKACAWQEVGWLTKMNVKPKNGRPIWSANTPQVDEDLATLAQEVATVVKSDSQVTAIASSTYGKSERANIATSSPVENTGGNKGLKNSSTWLLWIGAGALILVIGAGILIFLTRQLSNSGNIATEPPSTASIEPVFTVDELETRLNAVNIVFSTGTDEDRARVRSYVTGPTSAYYLLAVNCLDVVGAQRFKQTAYLDLIDKWYTSLVGEDNYVAMDGQLHVEQLKAAIVQAHNEYYGDTATAFEQLIEP